MPDGPADAATLILTSNTEQHLGGQLLRWRALRQALSRHGGATLLAVECGRWFGSCTQSCRTTGRPPGSAAPSWYFDQAFCGEYAADLARRCARTGIGTVVCSGMETHGYAVALAATGTLRVVYDMHNVELPLHTEIHAASLDEPLYSLFYTAEHLPLVAAAEGAAVAAADEVWTCSPQDRLLLAATYPGTPLEKIRVVPNAVQVPAAPQRGTPQRICFPGRFDYFPNIDAGRTLAYRIAPLVEAAGHDVPVLLAGARAGDVFDAATLPGNVRLVTSPPTTADLIGGSVMAVPLTIGSGSRFKVLEAFALGAPVVSTPKGVEGLGLTAGLHYLPATEPAGFAAAISSLLRDGDRRDRLVDAAFDLVRQRYSIDALGRVFDLSPR
jgi:glycosyltransferase involved in cell wall biosynthesis